MKMVIDTSHLNCSDLVQLDFKGDVDRASKYVFTTGYKALVLGIQILSLLIAVPGNVSFLLAVARVAYMRTITNIFLVNLALADIIFVVYTATSYILYLPAPVRSHIHSLINIWCPVAFSIAFLTYFASVSTVTLISLERYSAICRPLKHLAVNSKRRAVKLVLGTWVVALGFTSLAVLQYSNPVRICVTWPEGNDTEIFASLPDIIGFCLPTAHWALPAGNLASSVPFMVAVLANASMYVKIIRSLGNRPISRQVDGQPDMVLRARKVRHQVARMLVTNGTIFFICQFPYACINFIYIAGFIKGMDFLKINELQNDLRIFSHSLLFVNSAINPIIYYAMVPSYRRAAKASLSISKNSSQMN